MLEYGSPSLTLVTDTLNPPHSLQYSWVNVTQFGARIVPPLLEQNSLGLSFWSAQFEHLLAVTNAVGNTWAWRLQDQPDFSIDRNPELQSRTKIGREAFAEDEESPTCKVGETTRTHRLVAFWQNGCRALHAICLTRQGRYEGVHEAWKIVEHYGSDLEERTCNVLSSVFIENDQRKNHLYNSSELILGWRTPMQSLIYEQNYNTRSHDANREWYCHITTDERCLRMCEIVSNLHPKDSNASTALLYAWVRLASLGSIQPMNKSEKEELDFLTIGIEGRELWTKTQQVSGTRNKLMNNCCGLGFGGLGLFLSFLDCHEIGVCRSIKTHSLDSCLPFDATSFKHKGGSTTAAAFNAT